MYHLEGTVLTLGFLAFFSFLIGRSSFFQVGNIPVKWFQIVFLLKVLSGFFLYLIYTYYYTDRSTADIWKYFDDGMVMYSAFRDSPIDYFKMLFGLGNETPHFQQYYDAMNHWYRPYGTAVANDTHTIIRFNAFVRLFSLGHYNVHSVVANFLGLIGLTGILHFLRQLSPSKEKWFFAGVFLMPGMMFWASGVLKEPLLIFGLGLFLYSIWKVAQVGVSVGSVIALCISLFFLMTVKSYALAALLLVLAGWQLSRKFEKIHPSVWYASTVFIGIVGVSVLHHFAPSKSLITRIAQQQYEFFQLAEGGTYVSTESNDTLYIGAENYESLIFTTDRKELKIAGPLEAVYWKDAKQEPAQRITLDEYESYQVLLDYGKTGSTIDIPKLEPSLLSLLQASPVALVNATFRPFPWEIRSPFMLLSGLENLIILCLLVFMMLTFKPENLSNPVWYLAIVFAVIILELTGLVTPVIGAIVRYKVPALPFLVCAIIALADTEKIENWISDKFPALKNYL